MSELIDSTRRKKDVLKHLILQIHRGDAPEAVRKQLIRMLGDVPYDFVVEVEQELIDEGLPAEEVLKFCDIHSAVLKGQISHEGVGVVPAGHPVHTFREENKALQWETDSIKKLLEEAAAAPGEEPLGPVVDQLRMRFNALADVEKHYQRKEHLLFPFMEKHGITGPPKVMWGKHDEARRLLQGAHEALGVMAEATSEEIQSVAEVLLLPAVEAIEEMIFKEEQILLPMCLDTLSASEWHSVYRQSTEVGYCLYDPTEEWKPEEVTVVPAEQVDQERVQLPSGSFTPKELTAVLNSIPFDLTFVDKDDRVRYFTQGRERIFTRTRAILGRKVQLCHPPSSVHIVEQILADFRSGKQSRAPFWINMKGQFIHIEYFALRDENGEYLGTLEVSQNLTEKRALEGEQRLLTYAEEPGHES